ncbi:ATP-binding protein [Allopusillimonas ginsengisoli]|uniref:ATP-binding protein n=1 Tax=Allopusillimonas ginsengisoli TaxID=453575 RepID=UPI001021B396|nr:ATP-binding protein [Allopusillimonas ginsengisoli]TEA78968.1 HAMP domain-containing histidine kinase [Allopusillimonas ginsengisoli]
MNTKTADVIASGIDIDIDESTSSDDGTGRQNLRQLIQLRWIAVLGQVITILITQVSFDIPLPLTYMLTVVAGLILFNLCSLLRLRIPAAVRQTELFLVLLVDVIALTFQLYLSGGTTNPFIFLFLLQVALAAVLLKPLSTWIVVLLTACAFAGLGLVSRALHIPINPHEGLASPFVLGMLICFVLNAILLVIFITRITHNLRSRDARLATMRQRAVEEEHIVRMGLLASGAAHELGTPLATLDIILGDWAHIEPFRDNPELAQEVQEMQAQVKRCKAIVSGILMSAGEARGEALVEISVRVFLDTLVTQWRSSRQASRMMYENYFAGDVRIISDLALKQMICNVLDNALEASPRGQRLEVTREQENLVLSITDVGPGFTPTMLQRLGKPYQSSKGRPGGGLGLFLSLNVARTLGGSLVASNLPSGGACVTIRLPLSALTREETRNDV